MSATESAIPDTHRDCVLNAFLQGHTIPVLAEHYQLPVATIVAFLNSPEVQTLRDDIALLAASQAELATTHARTAAILTLHAVINGQDIDPAQVRAASSLLRTTPKAPPRPHHATASSPHVSNAPAPQPHAVTPSQMGARAGGWVQASKQHPRKHSRRHEPDDETHHEPIAERESDPSLNDPSAPRHARTEPDDADQASHESPADATAPDALHDHATPTTHSRDRPSAAA